MNVSFRWRKRKRCRETESCRRSCDRMSFFQSHTHTLIERTTTHTNTHTTGTSQSTGILTSKHVGTGGVRTCSIRDELVRNIEFSNTDREYRVETSSLQQEQRCLITVSFQAKIFLTTCSFSILMFLSHKKTNCGCVSQDIQDRRSTRVYRYGALSSE